MIPDVGLELSSSILKRFGCHPSLTPPSWAAGTMAQRRGPGQPRFGGGDQMETKAKSKGYGVNKAGSSGTADEHKKTL